MSEESITTNWNSKEELLKLENRQIERKSKGKKLFGLIYDIIGRIKENRLMDAGTFEQDLAGKFCNFFVDKITNLRDRLKDYGSFVVEKEREPGMLELNHVSNSYVEKLIGENKVTNCRTDPRPSKLIKKFKLYFTAVITSLISLSLRTGTFANDWKTSKIMPLIKKPNLSKCLKNYWPVKYLCIMSKYVEKAVLKQLSRCMTTHNLLPGYISAYRKIFSMKTILVKIHHDT